MDVGIILNILQVILYIILGGLAIWFRTNDKLKTKVSDLINEAEGMFTDTTKAGGQRFNWVVDSLYGLFPKAIQIIIPKAMVESIVQNVFDAMKDFAKKNLDAASGKLLDDK